MLPEWMLRPTRQRPPLDHGEYVVGGGEVQVGDDQEIGVRMPAEHAHEPDGLAERRVGDDDRAGPVEQAFAFGRVERAVAVQWAGGQVRDRISSLAAVVVHMPLHGGRPVVEQGAMVGFEARAGEGRDPVFAHVVERPSDEHAHAGPVIAVADHMPAGQVMAVMGQFPVDRVVRGVEFVGLRLARAGQVPVMLVCSHASSYASGAWFPVVLPAPRLRARWAATCFRRVRRAHAVRGL